MKEKTTKTKTYTLSNIPVEVWSKFKIGCIINGVTIKEAFIKFIKEYSN